VRATAYHRGRWLDESELEQPHDHCPLCLAKQTGRAVHRIQRDPLVELIVCPRCHGAPASRMPGSNVLDAYYAEYYSGLDTHTTTPDVHRFGASIARWLAPSAPGERVRVLDFGGGDGSIGLAVAGLLVTAGAAAADVVVDYDEPAPSPSPTIRTTGHRELADVDGTFDVVLASAVLEHIPRFQPVFLRLFSLCAAGGSMYVRTPWMAPFARLHHGLDLTFPAHVHDLGGGFWNRAVQTFALDAQLVRSGPSPVEASARTHLLRAGVAALLKVPAQAEARARRPAQREPWWRWVGGWEAVLRSRAVSPRSP
jgi:2-polyprenyl-3-methyl-5-hydroxy-6-metoxy-1,4-benzoquinol methylase